MTNSREIRPSGPLRARIRPPGSKSITNRAMVCAALADGPSLLTGALASDDTRVMIEGLRQLGVAVAEDPAEAVIRIAGCGGRLPAASADLMVGNSGTTLRFLTAVAALGHGTFRLDGNQRMRERPVQDLLDALGQLGVEARSELGTGCPPVVVRAAGLRGGRAEVAGSISSQYLSGLLMAAPYAREPVELAIRGELVSGPYVAMTLGVMAAFGVKLPSPAPSPPAPLRAPTEGWSGERGAIDARPPSAPGPTPGAGFVPPPAFLIPVGAAYRGCRYAIEPDASAASYFFAAAAVAGGSVTVEGLTRRSIQGDVAFCDLLEQMGCRVEEGPDSITVTGGPLVGIEADMNAISDTVQTLAAVALFARGPTTINHVGHIRHKETDRLRALATELRKLGAEVEERADGLRIVPRPLHAAGIDTYGDHRMAMSLALVGLAVPGVIIRDPGCTAKTYPGFFEDLDGLAVG
ncbi:MAG: 3-phosphoshikimate 1-carboxyvinyltransferase [Thermoguttaceae bacterium]|jgi:3-phosphoshikimate 1-carboxyvinyltransferase